VPARSISRLEATGCRDCFPTRLVRSHVYEYLYSACQMMMQAIVMMTTLCICANIISIGALHVKSLAVGGPAECCVSGNVEVKCVRICLYLCLSSVTMSVSVDVVSASMQYQCLHISKPGSLNKMRFVHSCNYTRTQHMQAHPHAAQHANNHTSTGTGRGRAA